MKSDTGSSLTKIAAIISIVVAGLITLFGLIAVMGALFYNGFLNLIGLLLISITIMLVMGILMLRASKKMKDAKTVKQGAIWAIVLGVLNIGLVTGILCFIGGIIALIDADKK